MKPLHFCMLTTFYPPYSFGGDASYVWRLSNALARRGHSVDVIHCVDSYNALASAGPRGQSHNEPGVSVHSLHSGTGILSPLATHLFGVPSFKAERIREFLSRKRFDVTHFHNVSLVGGPGVLRFGEGVKLYTLHEHWLVCPTHVLFKYNKQACVKKNCLRCTLSYRRPPQLWRYTSLLQRAVKNIDRFIAPSVFTRDRHLRDGLDIPVVYLPHGIDPAWDTVADGRNPAGTPSAARPYFLYAGRLEKLKGIQTVIPAFREDRGADLLIAGQGDFEPQLRALAGTSPHIRFVGQQEPGTLGSLYRNAVAVIVPSLTFETFGQIVIEAFSTKTPVIVRDIGALPELVRESGGGLVFRDDGDIAQALTRMLREPKLRDRLGVAGYKTFRAKWTEEIHIRSYLQLIDNIRRDKRQSVQRNADG